jgi:hypothetical protein
MTAAAHSKFQPGLACQGYYTGDISRVRGLDNGCRAAVYAAIEAGTRLIVSWITRRDDTAVEEGAQF